MQTHRKQIKKVVNNIEYACYNVSMKGEKSNMNKYQRSLLNKMDDLLATLQSDWQYRFLTKGERAEMEREYNALQSKLNASYAG